MTRYLLGFAVFCVALAAGRSGEGLFVEARMDELASVGSSGK